MLAVMADSREQIRDMVVEEPVTHVASIAPGLHQPQEPQHTELLRHDARREPGRLRELLDGTFHTYQREEQAQSTTGREQRP